MQTSLCDCFPLYSTTPTLFFFFTKKPREICRPTPTHYTYGRALAHSWLVSPPSTQYLIALRRKQWDCWTQEERAKAPPAGPLVVRRELLISSSCPVHSVWLRVTCGIPVDTVLCLEGSQPRPLSPSPLRCCLPLEQRLHTI